MSTAKKLGIAAALIGAAGLVAIILYSSPAPQPIQAQGLIGGPVFPPPTMWHGVPFTREIYGNNGDAINTPWLNTASGSGASTTTSGTSPTGDRPYVWTQTTGSTTTGRAGLGVGCSGGANVVFETGKIWTFLSAVAFTNLSDGTETYTYGTGYKDSIGGIGVDGCYFRYAHTESANWICRCAVASANTDVTSDVALAADTWNDLKIVVTGTATAQFYIDNVLKCTISSPNIPSGTTRATGTCAEIVKSAGTTPRIASNDYQWSIVDGLAGR